MQVGIIVIEVFYLANPAGIAVHFVQKKMRAAMRVMVFRKLRKAVAGKPQLV